VRYIAFILFGVYLLHTPVFSKEHKTTSDSIQIGKLNVTVTMTVKKFNAKKHRIHYYTYEKNRWVDSIDGAHVYGEDGGIPKTEIESLIVTWGDKSIPIKRSLYADCYNADLDADSWFVISASDDGKSLMILMSASDGAGAYTVSWIVTQEGTVTRFIFDDC